MKFGGLSEKEVGKISEILNREGISFEVTQDDEIVDLNSRSMNNDLRHYTPPNISTHILAIDMKDEDFTRLSDKGRAELLEFGITDQAPAAEEFQPFTGTTVNEEIAKSSNRMVAMNFKHQLILAFVLLTIYLIFEYVV